jgi:hypothetical protein
MEHGEGSVTAALAPVIQSERIALTALQEQMTQGTRPQRIAVPEPRAGYEVEAGKASDDHFLLAGRVS